MTEQLLPTPKYSGSNPAIDNFYPKTNLFITVGKTKIKMRGPGMAD